VCVCECMYACYVPPRVPDTVLARKKERERDRGRDGGGGRAKSLEG